jgi:hypothetical protein
MKAMCFLRGSWREVIRGTKIEPGSVREPEEKSQLQEVRL